MQDNQYNLTLFEACEKLSKSKKSISRYIRKGLLHPRQIKSKQGTLEYRFSESDLNAFKMGESETRQDTTDTQDTTQTPASTSLLEEKKEEKAEKVLTETQTEQTTQDRPDETEQPRQEETKKISDTTNETEKEKKILDKEQTERTGQDTPQETGRDRTGQIEIIELLKETTGLLKEQLTKKDEQINKLGATVDNLVERNREMNILLKGLQDKVLMLEQPKEKAPKEERQPREKRERKPKKQEEPVIELEKVEKGGFFKRLFK